MPMINMLKAENPLGSEDELYVTFENMKEVVSK